MYSSYHVSRKLTRRGDSTRKPQEFSTINSSLEVCLLSTSTTVLLVLFGPSPTPRSPFSSFDTLEMSDPIEPKEVTFENGHKLAYMDTGAPPNSSSYTTYIYIHGAANNKHTWDLLFTHPTSKDVRMIAYSQRGYDNSTPFTQSEIDLTIDPSVLLRSQAQEFADFLNYCISTLKVPNDIVLIGWSKGCIIPLALYFFEIPVSAQVTAIVFYEIPLKAWGAHACPSGNKLIWENPQLNQDTAPMMFAQYVTGRYQHPKTFFESRKDEDAAQNWTGSTMTNQALGPVLGKSIEAGFIPTLLHAHFTNFYEDSKIGFEKLLASGKRIGVVYGDQSVTECLLGSWRLEELAGDGRTKTRVVKEANHMMHLEKPEEFFKAIVEVSS